MRVLTLLSIIILIQACAATSKDEPARDFVRYSTPATSALSSAYKADTNCKKGDADCNVCANDVQKQFHDAVLGKLNWSKNSWGFNWNDSYNPDNATPKSIFGSPVKGFLGITVAVKHVQGFVRTNSDEYPYAGSHSHTSIGGIFVIKKTGDELNLISLHKTSNAHPSGVHILGKYLVYGESGNLVFKDLKSINQVEDISLSVDSNIFGGGLGFTKLQNGKYLMVGNAPGGEGGTKKNYFYELTFQNGSPSGLQKLSHESVVIPSDWNRKYILSENTSVISECGTGAIYVVNVSGETGVKLLSGRGYWRLSKLESNNGDLTLKAVNHYSRSQNTTSCNSRATGTVSVNSQHNLEFYCHEHGKDKSKSASKYRFQKGTF
jgi:hypothetical protein